MSNPSNDPPLDRTMNAKPRRRRAGTTLLEIAVSAILLSVLAATLGEGLISLDAVHAELNRRQVAQIEAANELQRVAALDWDKLVAMKDGPAQLSTAAKQSLAKAEMTMHIDAPAGEPDARRIRVELHWIGPLSGRPESPIRLSAWVYQKGRKSSP